MNWGWWILTLNKRQTSHIIFCNRNLLLSSNLYRCSTFLSKITLFEYLKTYKLHSFLLFGQCFLPKSSLSAAGSKACLKFKAKLLTSKWPLNWLFLSTLQSAFEHYQSCGFYCFCTPKTQKICSTDWWLFLRPAFLQSISCKVLEVLRK